ncbi:phage tail protein [Anabaena sp. FACHB-1237]|uniref:phage tail protein n=1 Tax=Anabaena sp. FACHB-1237 TaxID=2692769 RepID=UPI0016812EDD|nr:phage tail protein [Anabaena sp. FACHB-1237]MBD2137766.1 phage tail protein [Anabaena sp. FACHB-1237]
MTIAQHREYLSVQLTPMRISENALDQININNNYQSGAIITTDESGEFSNKQLVLYPGEPSEMLIQLENDSTKYSYATIAIRTNIPNSWCKLIITEELETVSYNLPTNSDNSPEIRPRIIIYPHSKKQILFSCTVPEDFFESERIWQLGQSGNLDYVLDYAAEINISYGYQNRPITISDSSSDIPEITHVRTEEVNLYIRPRSLYLNFLPDIYREVDFIGRLLKIFEETFEPAVQILDSLHLYLDPRTAPEALLPFLAHWVGWEFIPNITSDLQRYLIYRALEIYSWRGTKKGLRDYLHFYTGLDDDYIKIQDVFAEGFQIGQTHLGRTSVVGGGKPYHFVVRLYPENANSIDEKLVRKIIEQEKPAFCTYELYIKER